MKTRNGFVSNSSSSSFVILGKKINVEDLKNVKNPKLLGGYINEGQDVVTLDSEKIELIEKFGLKSDWIIIDSYKEIDGESGGRMSKDDLPEGDIDIIGIKKDYYCTEDINEFIEDYIKDPRKES